MTFYEKPDTVEEALIHYGVLGMRWGHHKTEAAPRATEYSDVNYNRDLKKYGKHGVERINSHIHNGLSYSAAVKKESHRNLKIALMIAGGAIAANILLNHGHQLAYAAQSGANKFVAGKKAAAGAKAAANLLADSRGIGSRKIVDLGFNAATGVWG